MGGIDATAEELAAQHALSLTRQRAADLLRDLEEQTRIAWQVLYASNSGPEVASALVLLAPKACELIDVAGICITADKLKAESAAYRGGAAPAATLGERGAGRARTGRPWMRRRL
jgi:hypothetical protein